MNASLALVIHPEQYYCTSKTVSDGRGITGWVNTSDQFKVEVCFGFCFVVVSVKEKRVKYN